MPTYPVKDLVVKNIVDTCKTINKENGYQIEMAQVQRGDDPKDITMAPAISVDIGRETKTHMTFPYQHCDLPVTIWFLIGSWTQLARMQNIALADLGKAMFAGELGYQRGGYAINTIEQGNETFYVMGTENAGVKVDYLIKYRHVWNDPYTLFA